MNLPNEAILASAGSGKTYQLTNRYIGLLAAQFLERGDCSPERIIALTFTKKAAGEFFDSIVTKLSAAALDDAQAQELAAAATPPFDGLLQQLSSSDYQLLLKRVIQAMPRLNLGTLDSFFASILQTHPESFGLSSETAILEDYEEANLRLATLDSLVLDPRFSRQGDSFKAFHQSYRLSMVQKEEAGTFRNLLQHLSEVHRFFLDAPAEQLWGNPKAIWPNGELLWDFTDFDYQAAANELLSTLTDEFGADHKQFSRWTDFCEDLETFSPHEPFTTPIKYIFDRTFEPLIHEEQGELSLKLNRVEFQLNPKVCDLLRAIWLNYGGSLIRGLLNQTGALWDLANAYEATYSTSVRSEGSLTFSDITLLLSGKLHPDEPAPRLTTTSLSDRHLDIAYRLDSRFDHWLLDEFQDTSFHQWSVIESLIDETFADDSGQKSYFQVGDIKQAIYGWRGGETGLFKEVISRYENQSSRSIETRRLDVSWRSCPDILTPVNQLFSDSQTMLACQFEAESVSQWDWADHESAPPLLKKSGITEWLTPTSAGEDPLLTLATKLNEVSPVERGLSCAVLVDSNKRANDVARYLRTETDLPVVNTSDCQVIDETATNALILSIFRFLAHPADSISEQHIRLSPLGDSSFSPAGFLRDALILLHQEGFESLLHEISRQLEMKEAQTAHSTFYLESLHTPLRKLDETGSRDLHQAIRILESFTVRDEQSSQSVQILTIHKAKGLTFDLCFLFEVDPCGKSLQTVRSSALDLAKGDDRSPEWVLKLPGSDIVKADPVLSQHHHQKLCEEQYETLCLSYVALTRARLANYLITSFQKDSSTAKNCLNWMREAWQTSDPEEIEVDGQAMNVLFRSDTPHSDTLWFQAYSKTDSSQEFERKEAKKPSPLRPQRLAIPDRRLSQHATDSGAKAFGSLVHQKLESLPKTIEELPTFIEALDSTEADRYLKNAFSRSERLADLFANDNDTLWIEKSFDILRDGQLVSGTFDRVILKELGTPEPSAVIIDFKTDASPPKTSNKIPEVYLDQMAGYRRALAEILGCRDSCIAVKLVYLADQSIFDL